MNAQAAEWLIVLLFFTCFFAFTAGEVYWLNNKRAIPFRKAFAFAFGSNILCITVGFFVSMVIVFAILAMAWEGSLQNVKGGDVTIWAAVIFAVVSPFVLLALAKFFLLKLFKFETIDAPSKYAVAASLLFFAVVTVIPCSAAYLLFG